MKTILIVDDEQDVRDIVRMRLARNPEFRVLEATNGREALELAKKQRPSLIILDWLMPGFNGMDVIKELRNQPDLATIPIIMMTVKGEQLAQAEGHAVGVFAYLVKPFDPDTLMENVQKALHEKC